MGFGASLLSRLVKSEPGGGSPKSRAYPLVFTSSAANSGRHACFLASFSKLSSFYLVIGKTMVNESHNFIRFSGQQFQPKV